MKRGLNLFLILLLVLVSSIFFITAQETEQEFYSRVQTISGSPVHSQITLEILLIQSGIGIESAITFEQNGFPRTLTMQQISMMREDRKNVFLSLLESSKSTGVQSFEEEVRVMPVGATRVGMPVSDSGFILENVEPAGARVRGQLLTLGSSVSFAGEYFGETANYKVTLIDFYFNPQMPTESWALLDVEVESLPEVGVEGETDHEEEKPLNLLQETHQECIDRCKEERDKKQGECFIKYGDSPGQNYRNCIQDAENEYKECSKKCPPDEVTTSSSSTDSSGETGNTEETGSIIGSGSNIIESIIQAKEESSNTRSGGSSGSSRARVQAEALKEARETGQITLGEEIKAKVGFPSEKAKEVIASVIEGKKGFIDEREVRENLQGLTVVDRLKLIFGIVTETGENDLSKALIEGESLVVSSDKGCGGYEPNDARCTANPCQVEGKVGICNWGYIVKTDDPNSLIGGVNSKIMNGLTNSERQTISDLVANSLGDDKDKKDRDAFPACFCDPSKIPSSGIPTEPAKSLEGGCKGVVSSQPECNADQCLVKGKPGTCTTATYTCIECLAGEPTQDQINTNDKIKKGLTQDKWPADGEGDKTTCYCEEIIPSSPGDGSTTTEETSCEDTSVEVAIRGRGFGKNQNCQSARQQATGMCWGRASNNYPTDAKSLCSASCKAKDPKCDVIKFEPAQLTPPVCDTPASCGTQTETFTTVDATGRTNLKFIDWKTATSDAKGTISVSCDCEESSSENAPTPSSEPGSSSGGETNPQPVVSSTEECTYKIVIFGKPNCNACTQKYGEFTGEYSPKYGDSSTTSKTTKDGHSITSVSYVKYSDYDWSQVTHGCKNMPVMLFDGDPEESECRDYYYCPNN